MPKRSDARREQALAASQPTTRLDASDTPAIPDSLRVVGGRYELLELLGEGGTARVYRARDGVLDRIVAVKLLRDEFGSDPDFVERFYREARSVASLSHPNIVDIYDYGSHDGTYFIIMQMVEGTDLKAIIRQQGVLPAERAAAILGGVLQALGAAHERGIIHRDVKPQNILIRESDGLVKLTDFGVARALGAARVTASGITFGTAHYMAPEQATGAQVGPATDLYAAGVVLYEALTARLPFDGDSPLAISLQHLNAPVPVLPEMVTPELAAVVQRALAKDPLARYPSAEAMREALLSAVDTAHPGVDNHATVAAENTRRLPNMLLPAATGGQQAPPVISTAALSRRRGGSGLPLVVLALLLLLILAGAALARAVSQPRVGAVSTATAATIVGTTLIEPTRTAAPPAIQPSVAPAQPPPTTAAPTAVPTRAPTAAPTRPPPVPTAVPPKNPDRKPKKEDFTPYQLQGAYRRTDGTLYGRPEVALYGEGTGYNQGTVTIQVEDLPDEKILLILTGLDDETGAHCRLQVTLNGATIFDGPNSFPNVPGNDNGEGGKSRYWGEMAIPVPAGLLREGSNTLVLRNRTPGTALGIPYMLINALDFDVQH